MSSSFRWWPLGPGLVRACCGGGWGAALAAAVILVLAQGLMLAVLFGAQDHQLAQQRSEQMRNVGLSLGAALDNAGRFALAQAEVQARRDDVLDAMAREDRAALAHLTQASYDYLKGQAGVNIFGFHSKDIRYLLRMHSPRNFNDDISGFRQMVVAANRSRHYQVGLEMGRAGIGVRGVSVLARGEQFLGTFEVGMDVQPLIESVKAVTNAEIAVLVSPQMSGVPVGQELERRRFGDVVMMATTDERRFATLLREQGLDMAGETRFGEYRADQRHYTVMTQPLVDFSGRMIGSIAILKDFAELKSGIKQTRTELWVVALCAGMMAFALLRVVLLGAAPSRDTA